MARLFSSSILKHVLVCFGATVLLMQCRSPQDTTLQKHQQPLTISGQFLVTPRWSPDGQKILASGHLGVGLFVVQLPTQEVKPWLPKFVGRAKWRSPNQVDVHLFPGSGGSSEVVLNASLDLTSGKLQEIPAPSQHWVDPKSKLLHEVLWDKAGRRITYQWFRQRLQVVEQSQVKFQQDGVWGVTVSPDGQRIAYSKGLLERGTLHLYDSNGEIELDRGVHPTWSPDGKTLVYSRPEANDMKTPAPLLTIDRQLKLMGADLYAVQFPSKRILALTQTPNQTEMEPTFSPTGDRLACADWRSGQILILPFVHAGAKQ